MTMEWKTTITCECPDETRGGRESGDGTTDGHDDENGCHTGCPGSRTHGIVEDLNGGEAESCRRTFQYGVDVDRDEEDGNDDPPAKCAVENRGHNHRPGHRDIRILDFFGHVDRAITSCTKDQ